MKFILLLDNIATLMHFLFAQTKQQYMGGAAFINGLITGRVRHIKASLEARLGDCWGARILVDCVKLLTKVSFIVWQTCAVVWGT